jgi:two-component system, NtrC family, sensor kinase
VGERAKETSFRRSVAARVLASYALVTLAFASVAGWSFSAQRSAARETRLVRAGYLPLALAVRDLAAKQDTWNTQLNHITSAKNPADIQVWFDLTLRVGRPRAFAAVRSDVTRAFVAEGDSATRAVGASLLAEVSEIERFVANDGERLERLFQSLNRGDFTSAERVRDEIVMRGSQTSVRLSGLEQSMKRHVDVLLDRASARELLAIRLLVALSVLTVLVGVLMAFYARRVLRPLAAVTERARAVARGDLEPQKAVVSDDEIGELAGTFEQMVAAIARANDQLVAAERLATIGKMAAHVTHEIRNPLSSIALNLELLEEQLPSHDAEARALFRAIGKEVERLSGLSQQYLAFARSKLPTREPEDVGALVEEAVVFVRLDLEKHDIRVKLSVEPGLPPVSCDEGQIKQVLLNLLQNARDAMPGGGEVHVGVRAEGVEVVISVDDQGPGVPAELRERLFEPFYTTKSHGTGLGLAITQHIATSHGGSIACEAAPGGSGARFVLRLPTRSRQDSKI